MTKLHGLVVCGGKSSRMGTDKSLINYHGILQRYYVHAMLQPFCEKVFLSCSKEQSKTIPGNYNVLVDSTQYENIGPMAALLTAFDAYTNASFLAIGCDYPFIRKEDLKMLIESRNENSMAVSYYNKESSIAEPLLTIYENKSFELMKEKYEKGNYSLRYFLEEVNALRIIPATPLRISSIDTHEQYQNAMRIIGDRSK